MEPGVTSLAWARALVAGLVDAGLREACISPGSRSTPLVLALAERREVRRFVQLDERSGAFFALGVGKRSGRPAAVVTTSGTAVANLHPAVIEASRSGAPLLLLTADRPPRLRGSDANQTVDQAGLFGGAVRLFHDAGLPRPGEAGLDHARGLAARAWSAAVGRPAGPVHLNLPFEKPLQPSPEAAARTDPGAAGKGASPPRIAAVGAMAGPRTLARLSGTISAAARGLIVVGPEAEPGRMGEAALALGRATGWPVLADPLSGARYREGALRGAAGAYDLFLRSERVRRALAPELVLRFGGPATSQELHDFLAGLEGCEQVAVSDLPGWPDHRGSATEVVRADPAALCAELADRLAGTAAGSPGAWTERWRRVEEAAREEARHGTEAGFLEGTVAEVVARTAPPGATLFVGSSMPVRDLDAFGAPRDAPLRVVGNRGASGIDGAVSTALGATAVGEGPALGVIGDLALLHDVNGLRAASAYGLPLVLVVVQNDGGGIFHLLPVREHEPHFGPYFATPHGLDLRHAAELYGVAHRRLKAGGVRGLGEELEAGLREALEEGGPHLIEVPSDRERNRSRREEVVAAAVEAAEGALEG